MIDWKIKDMIKKSQVSIEIGDEVMIFRRKSTGYPRPMEDGVSYVVSDVSHDCVFVKLPNKINSYKSYKVHRTYVINKSTLRDIKIDEIIAYSQ